MIISCRIVLRYAHAPIWTSLRPFTGVSTADRTMVEPAGTALSASTDRSQGRLRVPSTILDDPAVG